MDRTEFWLALTAVGGISVAISTAIALWIARRNRPEANWVIRNGQAVQYPDDTRSPELVYFDFSVTNAGDDSAFATRFTGTKTGKIRFPNGYEPVVAPGQTVRLLFDCPRAELESARLDIEWTRRPTRLNRRLSHSVHLDTIPLKVVP